MAIKIYNTLTREKEEFVPIDPPHVGMYVCGVTVYDVCHIGHARSYIVFDTVCRYLRFSGFEVKFVRNFTDVDDKIIKRANELNVTAKEIAEKYISEFHHDMEQIGVSEADVEPRATLHISQMIEMIQRIIQNGHAYITGGDVWFSIDSFPEYGSLSRRNPEEMKAGARIEPDERKRNRLDFALWKESKQGEPAWNSPWGMGRPGWHIECSAMSTFYLGNQFDIHGGGMDLIFPHHENETAQAKAANGINFVRYFLHNGFVNINEEKMSKSLKNFFTIKDVLAHYHPEALRYFCLTTHYRSPVNFSGSNIEEAQNRVESVYETIIRAEEFLKEKDTGEVSDRETEFLQSFRNAMDDDFNTAMALSVLSEMVRKINEVLDSRKMPVNEKTAEVVLNLKDFRKISSVLGVFEKEPANVVADIQQRKILSRNINSDEIELLLEQRTEARKEKKFARADEIREKLKQMGIAIMDAPLKTRWKVM
jgi:cysteinyl-tRNA synthetase